MNSQYPQNLKESIIFGMSNCIVMVCGMMAVNMFFCWCINPIKLYFGVGTNIFDCIFCQRINCWTNCSCDN